MAESNMHTRIESSANAVYKHIKKLQTRNGRTKCNQYLAEGSRLVADAIANGADIEYILISESYNMEFDSKNIKVYELSEKLFDSLKLTVNSQGVMAVVNYKVIPASSIDKEKTQTIVYLDRITDPGNMGTIIRSCDALGADAVVLSKGCVDLYNPKVVRSTMASLLNVPVFFDDNPEETLTELKEAGFGIAGTFPTDAKACHTVDYNRKFVLVMGNEANGIGEDICKLCTERITIPMLGRAESLNVATALTVMLYEIMRGKIINQTKDRGDK